MRRRLDSSPLSNVVALLIGGVLLLLGGGVMAVSFSVGGLIGAALLVGLAVPIMGAGAIFCAPVIAEWTGLTLAAAVYYPRLRGTLPPEHADIQGLLAKHEYERAQAELESRLSEHPGDPTLIRLLAALLMDHLHDYRATAGLLAVYFERPERDPEDGALVLRLVDAYLEMGEEKAACILLREELQRDYLSRPARLDLARRLEGLTGADG